MVQEGATIILLEGMFLFLSLILTCFCCSRTHMKYFHFNFSISHIDNSFFFSFFFHSINSGMLLVHLYLETSQVVELCGLLFFND